MLVHLLVLNFDGRRLLEECLPSVVDAARASRHRCEVTVVDNDSRDDSVAWVEGRFPQVRIIRRPNRGSVR
jgi:N-acetylglucosaminyl-diphospho-decaprenol L-rhamnosyltransferase